MSQYIDMLDAAGILQNDEKCARILLLGKTGVGKSSFINYFLNEDVAKAIPGEAVTKGKPHPYRCNNGKFPILIYDTEGIEAKSAKKQIDDIVSTVKNANGSDDFFNWFHTIFYVVSMAQPRFEDYEANLLRNLNKSISQHIHIILTHCDGHEEFIEEMRNTIFEKVGVKDNVKIFGVVSIEKRKRNGTVSYRRGKEKIEESVFALLWSDICTKISEKYATEAHEKSIQFINEFFEELIKIVDDFLKLFNIVRYLSDDTKFSKEVEPKIDAMMQKYEERVDKINQKYNEILTPVRQMFESYKGVVEPNYVQNNDLDFCLDLLDGEDFLDIDDIAKSVAPNLEKLDLFDIENASVWETLGSIFGACGDLLSLRKNVKKYFSDEKIRFLNKVTPKSEIQKTAYEKMIASVR